MQCEWLALATVPACLHTHSSHTSNSLRKHVYTAVRRHRHVRCVAMRTGVYRTRKRNRRTLITLTRLTAARSNLRSARANAADDLLRCEREVVELMQQCVEVCAMQKQAGAARPNAPATLTAHHRQRNTAPQTLFVATAHSHNGSMPNSYGDSDSNGKGATAQHAPPDARVQPRTAQCDTHATRVPCDTDTCTVAQSHSDTESLVT